MCGPIRKWKRAYEKANFGFVDFGDAFIALRTIRVLSTLSKASKYTNLVIKADDKVRMGLRQLEKNNKLEAARTGRRDDITQFLDKEAFRKAVTELANWSAQFTGIETKNEYDKILSLIKNEKIEIACHANNDFTSDLLLES
ncbi:putative RNA-binding protein 25, variant 2, partial [Bonamia ostreae]